MSRSSDRAFSRLLAEHDLKPTPMQEEMPPHPSASTSTAPVTLVDQDKDPSVAMQAPAGQPAGPTPASSTASMPCMRPNDEIRRILKLWDERDYFEILRMTPPVVDDLGRPSWPCSANDVSRAFRKISVLVHPDKNPGEDARKAFEALNEAHRTLRDPDSLSDVLRKAVVKLKADKERSEAMATGDKRIQLNSLKLQRVAELRRVEGRSFAEALVDQTRKRQEEAKRKAEVVSRSRVKEYEAKDEEEGRGGLNPLILRLQRDLKQDRSISRPDQSLELQKSVSCPKEVGEEEEEEFSHRVIKKKSKPGFM